MSDKSKLRDIERLAKRLSKIKAAQRRKFLNEDIVRLEKNGDLSYETVRTVGVREDGTLVDHNGRRIRQQHDGVAVGREADHGASVENQANPSFLPENLPQTPASHESGNKVSDCQSPASSDPSSAAGAQVNAPTELATSPRDDQRGDPAQLAPSISCHDPRNPGNQLVSPVSCPLSPPHDASDSDPLTELLHRALKAAAVRTGRPRALDDQAKGQLIALLSVGMSMRQAAAVLGVSHTTIQNVLKADPALGESITAARFQAQLQPLACVIREARRSWKAATWLLKYLDGKIASHEETPDERRQRQKRETDEFFGRSSSRGVKQRKTLG